MPITRAISPMRKHSELSQAIANPGLANEIRGSWRSCQDFRWQSRKAWGNLLLFKQVKLRTSFEWCLMGCHEVRKNPGAYRHIHFHTRVCSGGKLLPSRLFGPKSSKKANYAPKNEVFQGFLFTIMLIGLFSAIAANRLFTVCYRLP